MKLSRDYTEAVIAESIIQAKHETINGSFVKQLHTLA